MERGRSSARASACRSRVAGRNVHCFGGGYRRVIEIGPARFHDLHVLDVAIGIDGQVEQDGGVLARGDRRLGIDRIHVGHGLGRRDVRLLREGGCSQRPKEGESDYGAKPSTLQSTEG